MQNQQQTDTHSPMDTLVHLGAGRCSELDHYLSQHLQRIVLVEADPELAEDLQVRMANQPNIEIINTAVAGNSGTAILHRYNLTDVNSLHRPNTLLLELFPGLRHIEEILVNTIDPVSLLKPINLNTEQNNYLIIDIPGEELPVLKALQQGRYLNLFRHIQLHCGRQPLYENSGNSSDILQWLEDQGFDLASEEAHEDPDRPCFILRRNTLQLRNKELQKQIKDIITARDELARTAVEHKRLAEKHLATIDQLTIEREKLTEDHLSQINQLTQARDDQQTRIEQLTEERDKQIKLADERQTQLEQLAKASEEQSQLAEDRLNALERSNKDHEEQSYRQHLMDEELVKAEAQIKLITDILIRDKAF